MSYLLPAVPHTALFTELCLKDESGRNDETLYKSANTPLGYLKNILPIKKGASHLLIFSKLYFGVHWSTQDYQVKKKNYNLTDANFCDASCRV